ncbi:serine/threonine-protein kinase, partial [Nocardiopsis sp. MG754419]|uniref:serine/threonine-protein kinase n=1 Tax=Nocardiopsis sp. MG754419 TaxID=2259865 RepID=UPI001BA8D226
MKRLAPSDPAHIGPHRLLARLGSGGMGRVYLARTPDGGLAAVKVVHPELARDAGFRARFGREAAVAGRVHGPWTPMVLGADPEADAPWMATEYVPGPTLKAMVAEIGPLPLESLRVLALGLARGLATVHAAGLMHRDLKPSNVLLSPRGPQVIDFGIARAVEGTVLTKTGETFGTPAYTTPEAIQGRVQTPASDVFSLAGTVVFAATGAPPFGPGRAAEVLPRIVAVEPRLEQVPEPLRPLLAHCLAKDPEARPGADEIAATLTSGPMPSAGQGWLPDRMRAEIGDRERELHRLMAAVPIAPPEEPAPAPRRRRGPWAVGAAVAAVVLLAAGGLALTLPGAEGDGETTADGGVDTDTGEVADPSNRPALPGTVDTLRFSPGGDTLHVLTDDGLTTWDWRAGTLLEDADTVPAAFDVNADGVWATGEAGHVRVLPHGDDRTLTHPAEPEGEAPTYAVSLADEAPRVAYVRAVGSGSVVTVWDWESDEVLFEETYAHQDVNDKGVRPLLSPDGGHLALPRTLDEDTGLTVVEPDTGRAVLDLTHDPELGYGLNHGEAGVLVEGAGQGEMPAVGTQERADALV